ncbi:MAG: zinc-binding alcohol dehydrogenase family protein [Phycisphaeraceae bacterium]
MDQIVLEQPGRFAQMTAARPAVGRGEILVRVHRIGVCGTDLHAFAGRQPFFEYPRVLGHELGVEVVELGEAVRGVSVGDRGAVEPYLHCGACGACGRGRTNCCEKLKVLGVHIDGGMRPWLAVPAGKLHCSTRLSFDQLALVETLAIGAHGVERGQPAAGEHVLVAGAGPIGLGAIQFAQAAGADVAVLDVSEPRRRFCEQTLGVTRTFDATDDLPDRLRRHFGDLPTLVIDATGHAGSMQRCFELTGHGGRIVFLGLFKGELTFDDPNFHKRELTLLASRNATASTFAHVIAEVEAGRVDTTPWITHRLALTEVPAQFANLAGQANLLKAMIEVKA